MAGNHDKVTRFDADLVEAAAAEGARHSRSGLEQLAHWVRVGRVVSSVSSAQHAHVEAALSGQMPMKSLSAHESVIVNAEISAGIEERLAQVNIGAELAAEGITTVTLDEDGNIIEHQPDGTTATIASL